MRRRRAMRDMGDILAGMNVVNGIEDGKRDV